MLNPNPYNLEPQMGDYQIPMNSYPGSPDQLQFISATTSSPYLPNMVRFIYSTQAQGVWITDKPGINFIRFIPIQSSGDPNTEHFKTGTIRFPDIFSSGYQMVMTILYPVRFLKFVPA
jgi:hypothetical protein